MATILLQAFHGFSKQATPVKARRVVSLVLVGSPMTTAALIAQSRIKDATGVAVVLVEAPIAAVMLGQQRICFNWQAISLFCLDPRRCV
jgi:hypothetical protein